MVLAYMNLKSHIMNPSHYLVIVAYAAVMMREDEIVCTAYRDDEEAPKAASDSIEHSTEQQEETPESPIAIVSSPTRILERLPMSMLWHPRWQPVS
jgi:hypothetical protein